MSYLCYLSIFSKQICYHDVLNFSITVKQAEAKLTVSFVITNFSQLEFIPLVKTIFKTQGIPGKRQSLSD